MEYFVIEPDILVNLEQKISDTNKSLFDKLQKPKVSLCSTDFLKISYSENLLEDIEFLNKMSGTPIFKIRYANLIIRNMLEQVIEFIYLLEHAELIEQFLGINIESDIINDDKFIENYLQLGGKRYINGRKRISKMADSIHEKYSTEDTLSLYDIYRSLSEQCHNSYFLSILDDVDEVETDEKNIALTNEQLTYLTIIIECFMKAYIKK